MAIPTRETRKICCNKNPLPNSYSYLSQFDSQIKKLSSQFSSLFITEQLLSGAFFLAWALLGLVIPLQLCISSWSRHGALDQEITGIDILTFTCAPQSYLAFEGINVSSQIKPCILRAHFTQAIGHSTQTLSPLLLLTLDHSFITVCIIAIHCMLLIGSTFLLLLVATFFTTVMLFTSFQKM